MNNETLKKRILEEMTVDYSSALEKNFDIAKKYVNITKKGKVDVKYKERLAGEDRILLYLIGKLYAKAAELTASVDVGNKELMDELGIPQGSLLPWLKNLREANGIESVTRNRFSYHKIRLNNIERTLKRIDKKLSRIYKEKE